MHSYIPQYDNIAILAPGSSLTQEQVDYIKQSGAYSICIGDVGRVMYPDADILYHADASWWYYYKGCPNVSSTKITAEPITYGNIIVMKKSPKREGIDLDYPHIVFGTNSGYQAINLAMYFNPKKIVLVGYDMKDRDGKHNIIGEHPKAIKRAYDFNLFIRNISSLADVLDKRGVTVYNCTLDSALTCFEKRNLEDVL